MAAQTRAEPMNSSPHHPKVKVSTTVPDNGLFVAGTHVSGRMEMECRADKGLAIGDMIVELFASQELTSRDHSATSTFLHSRRLFQGPGLPPSNAVQAYPQPGDPPLPKNYYHARRGLSTFLFRIPLPSSSPSSIRFGGSLARVKYELRATVAVIWKGERRLVTHTREVDVVESWEVDFSRVDPEGIVVGEHGKIWAQGKVIGGMIVAGEPGCLELQVKNHSTKKNTGLTLSLGRQLLLPGAKASEKQAALQISDVLTTVPFRGPEYIIHPGAEGVASLVFDVPKGARGAKGGMLGDESEGRTAESLFEVRCTLSVTINMGIGTKDIQLNLPVAIIHPAALPELEQPGLYAPAPYNIAAYSDLPLPVPFPPHLALQQTGPYLHPMSPPIPAAYIDEAQGRVWLPPPVPHTPQPQPVLHHNHHHYVPSLLPENQPHNNHNNHVLTSPPPPIIPVYLPPRPLSADGPYGRIGMGRPPRHSQQLLLSDYDDDVEPEEGKERDVRHRSVSPRSHRFPLPQPTATQFGPLPPPVLLGPSCGEHNNNEVVVHSPRPYVRSYSTSTNKSERVEELERMAEEEEEILAGGDLLGLAVSPVGRNKKKSLEGASSGDVNKTLPRTPLGSVNVSFRGPGKGGEEEGSGKGEADRPVLPTPASELELELNPTPSGVAISRVRLPFKSKLPLKPKSTEVAPFKPKSTHLHLDSPRNNVETSADNDLNLTKAPATPQAAITPVKLPSKLRSEGVHVPLDGMSGRLLALDDMTGRLLPSDGRTESGLDALERRLLAEVGTRKVDFVDGDGGRRVPDVRSVVVGVQPIDIPGRDRDGRGARTGQEEGLPLNDSAISSLALAGEGVGVGVAAGLLVPEPEREREHEGDGDSDERTHRGGEGEGGGGRSSGSAGSRRRVSGRSWGENGRGRRRKSDDERERERVGGGKKKHKKKDGTKKAEAAKGRVAAWLGGIEPEVPPLEEDVMREPGPAFLVEPDVLSSVAVDEDGWNPIEAEMKDEHKPGAVVAEVSSAPNPRSSGFVPIGTLKHDTLQHRRFHVPPKESTVVVEAKHVTDLWSSSSPPLAAAVNAAPHLWSPSTHTVQSIRTDRRVSPPSSAAVGANRHEGNAEKPLTTVPKHFAPSAVGPVKKVVVHQPSPRAPAFPPPRGKQDPEVKYDLRSARGGRGGQVTAIASIWGSSGGLAAAADSASQGAQVKKSIPIADDRLAVASRSIRAPSMKPILEDSNKNAVNVPSAAPPFKVSQGPKPLKVERTYSRDSPKKVNVNPNPKLAQARVPSKSLSIASNPSRSTPAYGVEPNKSVEFMAKRARPLVKSASIPVPAIVSSSHATPMLSSTASLARPAGAPKVVKSTCVRVVGNEMVVTSQASPSLVVKQAPPCSSPSSPPKGDLAFGQARLRDLIKKYQGQGA